MNFTPGSRAGRWVVMLPPPLTRSIVLRVAYDEPARVALDENGVSRVTPLQAFEVGFVFNPVPEGQWGDAPTLASTEQADDHNVIDFLRAVVEEAAKIGIVARDSQGELTAVRAHLDDMRLLALQGAERSVPAGRTPRAAAR